MSRRKKYNTEEERKQAKRESERRWRRNHPDKVKEYNKRFRENNPAYMPEYYQKNKEKLAEYSSNYYENHHDEFNEYYAEWIANKRTTQMGRAQMHVDNYTRIDKIYNRGECTLTAEWIVDNIFTQSCHYCGETDWKLLGCDRIDNSLPHTPENCVPCCKHCNNKKGITPYEEFIRKIGKVA